MGLRLVELSCIFCAVIRHVLAASIGTVTECTCMVCLDFYCMFITVKEGMVFIFLIKSAERKLKGFCTLLS